MTTFYLRTEDVARLRSTAENLVDDPKIGRVASNVLRVIQEARSAGRDRVSLRLDDAQALQLVAFAEKYMPVDQGAR